jgi:DNA polymerase-3 subunit beta
VPVVKFEVNKDVFSEAVSFAVKLLPQRTTLPILSGVLIVAETSGITISSFDYEVSAKTRIDADVSQPGTVLVSGRLLAEIAQRLPGDTVRSEVTGTSMAVSSGSAKFSLATMPVEEYPNLPEVSGVIGKIQGPDFASAVSQVATAASRDDVTPVITGVLLAVTSTGLAMMATDRYRVAAKELAWSGEAVGEDGLHALIPARTLAEIGKTFGHATEMTITIATGGDRELVAFSSADRTVTSLLIKGTFPPVQKLFPESSPNYAVVSTQDLIEATRRVALVLEREAPLRYSFTADGVALEALGSEQAQASETIDGHIVGNDCVVSLKPQFLIDGLSAAHSEFVRIAFTQTDNPNKPGPVLITAQTSHDGDDSQNYRYLLQPNLLMR